MGFRKIRHEPSLPALYEVFNSYKDLYDFYYGHRKIATEEEIRARMNYVIKNKLKQLTEIEAYKWVLGELNNEENFDKTKNSTRSY